MASSSLAIASLLLLLFHLSLSLPLLVASAKAGFSVELRHRDSPKSPFYDPSKTHADRLREAVRLSITRANNLRRAISVDASNGGTYESDVIPNSGSYLMDINIGSPANEILAIADTGSDLIWTNCVPCTDCYSQDAPLFNPTKSKTYRNLACSSDACSELSSSSCGTNSSTCEYSYSYGDQSTTQGNLASETFTFNTTGGRSVQIPKLSFGCSHQSQGTFNSKTAGLVGLGGGALSLVSQLGSTIDKKFSYCLVPFANNTSSSSKLSFGADAVVSGKGVVSIPLIAGEADTFYTVSLKSITVKGQDDISVSSSEVIVDSGTTLTFLDSSTVESLVQQLSTSVGLPTVDDSNGVFELCFNNSGSSKGSFPDITFQFGSAALTLTPLNTFVQTDDTTICLAIVSSDTLAIIGNIAQTNFHVGYDLDKNLISFARVDCTKF